MFYKNWTIFNLCQKKNYIILNFNYPIVNTFLVIFLNQKVRSILLDFPKYCHVRFATPIHFHLPLPSI